MENNNFIMVDNAAAGCATWASYKLAKRVFTYYGVGSCSIFQSNPVVDLGVNLASACFGLWAGTKVREKSREIRKNLSSFKKEDVEKVQQQVKDFQDWMNSVD